MHGTNFQNNSEYWSSLAGLTRTRLFDYPFARKVRNLVTKANSRLIANYYTCQSIMHLIGLTTGSECWLCLRAIRRWNTFFVLNCTVFTRQRLMHFKTSLIKHLKIRNSSSQKVLEGKLIILKALGCQYPTTETLGSLLKSKAKFRVSKNVYTAFTFKADQLFVCFHKPVANCRNFFKVVKDPFA